MAETPHPPPGWRREFCPGRNLVACAARVASGAGLTSLRRDLESARQLIIQLRSGREGEILAAAAHAVNSCGRGAEGGADKGMSEDQSQQHPTGRTGPNLFQIGVARTRAFDEPLTRSEERRIVIQC